MLEDRVAAFLKELNIKKHPLGGFDRADTLNCFKELILAYEEIIDEYAARERESNEFYQSVKRQLDEKLRDEDSASFILEHEKIEMEKMRSESDRLRNELEVMTAENLSLREDKNRLASELNLSRNSHDDMLIKQKYDNIRDHSSNLLSKVKEKADAYLNSAREESELIRESALAEKAELLKAANDEILRRRAELSSEISTLQNEHRMVMCALQIIQEQLCNVLENTDDFSDINILI